MAVTWEGSKPGVFINDSVIVPVSAENLNAIVDTVNKICIGGELSGLDAATLQGFGPEAYTTTKDTALEAYYSFDYVSEQLIDSSINENHGTITGLAYESGVSGIAGVFDGTSSYAEGIYPITDTFTLTCWVKTNTALADKRLLTLISSTNAYRLGFFIHNGVAELRYKKSDGNLEKLTALAINDSEWHNLSCTYDGTNLAFYVDGVIVSSAVIALISTTEDIMYICCNENVTDFTSASIDEVKMYSREFNPSEIASLYTTKKDVKTIRLSTNAVANSLAFRTSDGSLEATSLKVTDGSYKLSILGSSSLTADRTLTFNVANANRSLTVDSSGTVVTLDATQTLTNKKIALLDTDSSLSFLYTGVNCGIQLTNTSTGQGIRSSNTSAGVGIWSNNSSTGVGIHSSNTSTGWGMYSINGSAGIGIHSFNTSTGVGIQSNNTSTGWGIFSFNESAGIGIYSYNPSTGTGIRITNESTGHGLYISGATGPNYISGTTLTIVGQTLLSSLTASRALYLDASKNITSSSVTSTELGYLSGVTSAIQTQLGTKEPSLGNPAVNGYFLTSTTTGVRSWVELDATVEVADITDLGTGWSTILTTPSSSSWSDPSKLPLAGGTMTGDLATNKVNWTVDYSSLVALGYMAGHNSDGATGGNDPDYEGTPEPFIRGRSNIAIGAYALYSNITMCDTIAIGEEAFRNLVDLNTYYGQFGVFNNMAVGNKAGKYLTSGTSNTLIGSKCGYRLTSGDLNVFVGSDIVWRYSAATVTANTGVGVQVFQNMLSGLYNPDTGETASYANCAFGMNAIKGDGTIGFNGKANTAVGTSALCRLSTGTHNTGIGYFAGTIDAHNSVSSGTYNTFLGAFSGYGIKTGNYNTIIGGQSVRSVQWTSTLSNNVVLMDGQENKALHMTPTTIQLGNSATALKIPYYTTAGFLYNDASGNITSSSIPWADISSKPTTMSGYGITDGVLTSGNGMATWTATNGNLTIVLGTPSSITNSSTNSVTSTSHTHAISGLTTSNLSATAGIVNAQLANSSLTVNGTAIALGGSGTIKANTTNSLILKFDTGATEGTSLYTFNGSASKTIDIKAGTGVTLTKAAGSITISGAEHGIKAFARINMRATANKSVSYTQTGTVVTVTLPNHRLVIGQPIYLQVSSGGLPSAEYVVSDSANINQFTVAAASATRSGAGALRLWEILAATENVLGATYSSTGRGYLLLDKPVPVGCVQATAGDLDANYQAQSAWINPAKLHIRCVTAEANSYVNSNNFNVTVFV